MADPLQTTLLVDHLGEQFEFAIPTIYDDIKVGVRGREIRRLAGDTGDEAGMDFNTKYAVRACATFDVLLKKGPKWTFVSDAKEPTVDSTKFGAEHVDKVFEVYGKFSDLLTKFRAGGNPDQPSPAK